MNRIEYPISTEYCRNWSMTDAIREIIANAMDEGNYQITYDASTNGCYITNVGSKIQPKHLVLGNSSKNAQQIGQFGEGLKIAALVAARLGRKFYVSTNEFSFRPVIEYKEELDSQILVLELEETTKVKEETMVFVECSKGEYEDAKGLFLQWSKCKPISQNTPHILTPGGKLFVNGLFTMNIDSIFSYNVESKEFVNRDRTMVNLEAAKKEIEKIGEREGFSSRKFCEEYMMAGLVRQENKMETDIYFWSSETKMLKSVLKKMLGGAEKIAISDGTPSDLVLQDAGYSVIKDIRNWSMKSTLKSMLGLKGSTEELQSNPPKSVTAKNILKKEEIDTDKLNKAIAVAEQVLEAELGTVKVVRKFMDNENTEGEYDTQKDQIFVREDIVNEGGAKLLGTLIHEGIHKIHKVSDRTREFEYIMTDIIGKLAAQMM